MPDTRGCAALTIACFTKLPMWTLRKPLGEPTIEIQHPTTNQTFSDGDALVAVLLVHSHSHCDCQQREPYSILVKKSQRLLRRADQRLRDDSARLRDADDTGDECCRRFGPFARCGDMLYLAHGERRVGCDRRVPFDRSRAVDADSAVGWAHRRSFTCRKRRDGQLGAASPRGR